MDAATGTRAGLRDGFAAPMAFLFLGLAAICFNYQSNLLTLASLVLLVAATLLLRPSRFQNLLFFVAVPFGTLGEWLCSSNHLWIYANPTVIGLPVWLPLAWPLLIVNFTRISEYLDGILVSKLGPANYGRVALLLKILVVGYAASLFFVLYWVVPLIMALFVLPVLVFGRKPFHWLLFVVAAIGGSAGEAVCIRFGVWHYTYPAFQEIGFPVSLPLAWGMSANLIWLTARAFDRKPAPAPAAA
jgi:hypothetical protein